MKITEENTFGHAATTLDERGPKANPYHRIAHGF